MINLEELTGGGVNLADFVIEELPTDQPILNKATANNLAAHTALLTSPDSAMDAYETITKELDGNVPSPTMDNILGEVNQRERDLTKSQMVEVAADESLSIEDRINLVRSWEGANLLERDRTPEELLQINSIEQEGLVENNEQVNETRYDILGWLDEVNAYESEVQRMITLDGIQNSPGALEGAVDFLELVVPFLEGAAVAEVQVALRDYYGKGDVNKAAGVVRSLGLLGESKEQIRDIIRKVPVEKRLDLAKAVRQMVLDSEGSLVQGKNSMMIMDSLRNYLVEGHYTTGDRIIDDVTSLLDIVGLGSSVRAGVKGLKSVGRAAAVTKRVPNSVAGTLANTNAKSYNEVLKMAIKDETGEVAKVVSGTSKDDFVVQSMGPEIALPDGTIRNKPVIDDELNPDMDVVNSVASGKGFIQFSEAEKADQLARVKAIIEKPDVNGIVPRKEMTTIVGVDEGISVKTVFGPAADGGFTNARQAVELAKRATRKLGITDDEITVLKRGKDGTYKPISLSDKSSNLKGNYLIQIDNVTRYDPSDTSTWTKTDARATWFGIPLNVFDRMPQARPGKGGNVTQHLIPPTSMIDPLIVRGASIASDQVARSIDLMMGSFTNYAKKRNGLDSMQQAKVDEYIIEANQKSLKFQPNKLKADGFSDEAIEALRDWKQANDTHYVLENIALVRKSKRAGYELFVSKDKADINIVRPMAVQQAGSVSKVYDPQLGMIRNITAEEKSALYKNGGTIATARTPIKVGDDYIPHILVKNDETGYTRALRETDRLLNYRDGHFTIYYDAPIFIIEKGVKNADGTTYDRAIATAGSVKDAENYIADAKARNPNIELDYRPDVKGEEFDEMNFQVRHYSGRTATKTRGETLKDVSNTPDDPDFRHIMSPEESVIRSIVSIANHVNMNDFLDTAKARFMDQYKKYLPRDPQTKAYKWPDDATQLNRPTGLEADAAEYGDAVSTYRYIDQMENGFINLLDDTSKNFFKFMAETSGAKGWGWVEKAARGAEKVNPSQSGRKLAFNLMLAANPLRQIPIQAAPVLPLITATNPTFLAKLPQQLIFLRYLDTSGDANSFMATMGSKLTGLTLEEAKALEKAYHESALKSAVSAHSFTRDHMKQLVTRGVAQKAMGAIEAPFEFGRKIGFDVGENLLMKSVWLSEMDLLRKSGKPMDAANKAMVSVRTRDLTLNMNRAAEFAYNENMFSAFFQFVQAPHKAFAQVLMGHRGLSKMDRLKLGASYTLVYGTGYGVAYNMIAPLLPEDDKELKEAVAGGLFNIGLNNMLSTIWGDEVKIDFSNEMRPFEIPNLPAFWSSLAVMNPEEVLKGSPSLGLVMEGGRLNTLADSIGRIFTVPDDPQNFQRAGEDFLRIFSGVSNVMKAKFIMEKGKVYDNRGNPIVDADGMDAFMAVAGFKTYEEVQYYASRTELFKTNKERRDAVNKWWDTTTKLLTRDGITKEEFEYNLEIARQNMYVFKDDPMMMKAISEKIQLESRQGNYDLLRSLMKMGGSFMMGDLQPIIDKSSLSEEDRRKLNDFFKNINLENNKEE